MIIRRGYKYRLKANKHIRQQFVKNAGACRFVWNRILSLNEGRYLAGVPRLTFADACTMVAWWKQSEEYAWLQEANAQSLQQCLKDLEHAYTNLYAGRTHPPRYRKK